ncbi:hypothetical protein BJ508DRAFT_336597 [Ascobolus immersus RN42]|uniref:Uncharacterized protein n=1 Tax=Ascobolus immersus RN42 TaxID=1160509 RepID=A0A3N4HFM6_ASCIM|nr:hypothetical protein BJ508DRAFT_336597 [Ascobolus immersus RN42]
MVHLLIRTGPSPPIFPDEKEDEKTHVLYHDLHVRPCIDPKIILDEYDTLDDPLPLGFSYNWWLDKIPRFTKTDSIESYIRHNADLIQHFLGDYYLMNRQAWDPETIERMLFLSLPTVRKNIMKDLGLKAGEEASDVEFNRVLCLTVGDSNEPSSNQNRLSFTNSLPIFVITELALTLRKNDRTFLKLFSAAFRFSPWMLNGAGFIARLRPEASCSQYPYKSPPLPAALTAERPTIPETCSEEEKRQARERIEMFDMEAEEARKEYECGVLNDLFDLIEERETAERLGQGTLEAETEAFRKGYSRG